MHVHAENNAVRAKYQEFIKKSVSLYLEQNIENSDMRHHNYM